MKNILTAYMIGLLLEGVLFSQVQPILPKLPAGAIDGSQTPELISDAIAYKMVFSSLMLSDAATPLEINRQSLKLKGMGLASTDLLVLRGLIAQFSTQYASWRSRVRLEAPSTQLRAASEAAMDGVVQVTRDLIAQQVSSDGNAKLAVYVQKAKHRMVIQP